MRTRYLVLIMLVLLSIITYTDRICIGVAGGKMQKALALSDTEWGWVLGAFLLAYGLFEIPSGALGDRIGQRKVLTRIVVWWSAFTMLTGVATGFYSLVATRFLFGAGEAGAYPNASGCIGRWFPVGEQARAQGLIWSASRVGGALTPLVVVPLLKDRPWQVPFFFFGAIGFVWAAVWFGWFRDDPAGHPAVTPAELSEIGANHSRPNHSGVPWRRLFASPQLWLIMAMYWFYVFGAIFFMFSLPKYLTNGRNFSDGEMAICVALAFGMGAIGNVAGGWVSDRLSRRFGLRIGRNLPGTVCLLLTGLLLFATAFTPGKIGPAILLILAFGVMDGMLPAAWALCLDVGKRYAGAVSGSMNMAGQAAGYVSTVLYGYLITWYGDYELPMILFAVSMWIGALVFALLDPTRPLIPETESPAVVEEAQSALV
ncbi:MAG: MFS transporter [Planctomycetaceae bacterium]